MIEAIDPDFRVDWTYPGDDDDPTVFEIRRLTARETTRMVHLMDRSCGYPQPNPDSMEYALDHGLVGWRNFKDASGALVEFDSKNPAVNVDRLPELAFVKLASAIMAIQEPSGADRKK